MVGQRIRPGKVKSTPGRLRRRSSGRPGVPSLPGTDAGLSRIHFPKIRGVAAHGRQGRVAEQAELPDDERAEPEVPLPADLADPAVVAPGVSGCSSAAAPVACSPDPRAKRATGGDPVEEVEAVATFAPHAGQAGVARRELAPAGFLPRLGRRRAIPSGANPHARIV